MSRQTHNISITLILAAILLLATACASQSQTPTPTPTAPPFPTPASVKIEGILGKWGGVDNNNEVTLFFDADGKVTLSYLGSLHGGTYTLHEQADPMQLDLIWDDIGPVLTILEFVDEDTIRFENNYPGEERPTEFSDFITLTRVK
jgi:hypothetical protein